MAKTKPPLKSNETPRTTMRIPPETRAAVKAQAKAEDRSEAKMTNILLLLGLKVRRRAKKALENVPLFE